MGGSVPNIPAKTHKLQSDEDFDSTEPPALDEKAAGEIVAPEDEDEVSLRIAEQVEEKATDEDDRSVARAVRRPKGQAARG